MGAKSEALAKQFQTKAQEATAVLEKMTDADWQKVTDAEKWSSRRDGGICSVPGAMPTTISPPRHCATRPR